MRVDKLTTKFQQALNDAQSLAVGHDHTSIEAAHLLSALLSQDDGGTASLLARAGVNLEPLKAGLQVAINQLPKVAESSGEVAISRDLNNLLNLTDKHAQKRGDAYIASEMFLLALADMWFGERVQAPQIIHKMPQARRGCYWYESPTHAGFESVMQSAASIATKA